MEVGDAVFYQRPGFLSKAFIDKKERSFIPEKEGWLYSIDRTEILFDEDGYGVSRDGKRIHTFRILPYTGEMQKQYEHNDLVALVQQKWTRCYANMKNLSDEKLRQILSILEEL